jgi:regulator of sigma E protease
MLGGIIMNVILAWFIYSMIAFSEGESYLPAENAVYGIDVDSLGASAGFRNGDIIVSHDGGKKFKNFHSIVGEILLDDVKKVEVIRDGQPYTITIPDDFIKRAVASRAKGFIDYRIPCMVGEFAEETVLKGKLQKGDVIIAINDSPVTYFQEAKGILATLKEQPATIKYIRAKDTLTTSVVVPASGLLGFRPPTGNDIDLYKGYLNIVETKYGFFESFGKGAELAYYKIGDYLKQFKLIFNRDVQGYKQIGGIGTIGSIFPATWNWLAFWQLTAFLSLMLAVMNLLPIPMLDGGYVILLLFEMVTRTKLSDTAVEYVNRVGFVIVIFLMLYANGMDIFRAFFEK